MSSTSNTRLCTVRGRRCCVVRSGRGHVDVEVLGTPISVREVMDAGVKRRVAALAEGHEGAWEEEMDRLETAAIQRVRVLLKFSSGVDKSS